MLLATIVARNVSSADRRAERPSSNQRSPAAPLDSNPTVDVFASSHQDERLAAMHEATIAKGADAMTGEQLQTYTRKRLAAMARKSHVAGWHDMRKADLIDALLADEQRQETLAPADESPFDPLQFSNGDDVNEGDSSPNNGSQITRSHRSAAHFHLAPVRHLLRTVDRDHDHFLATAVSPHWIRAEWTVTHASLRRIESVLGSARHTAEPVLRMYDISSDERLTHALTFVSDTPIPDDAHEWYLEVDRPGGTYQLQLGIRAHDGEFHRIASSDRINTGELRGGPPSAAATYDGQPTPGRRRGIPSSRRTLPLAIDVELVVRGATHPQAVVEVLSDPVNVDADGTFEHALPLSEGRQIIPIVAASPDGRLQRTIVIAIDQNTKRLAPMGPSDT